MKNAKRVILTALVLAIALASSSLLVQAPANDYWFDTAWHFRVNFTISNTNYERADWPMEIPMNFTNMIKQAGKTGTFDYNSIRVYAENSSGGVTYQMPHQFENSSNFDIANNADGLLVFLLNGTTSVSEIRYISVYFDTEENGIKTPATYPININYSWDGEEAHVNNTKMRWKIDTIRGENTSGLYEVQGTSAPYNIIFTTASHDSRTKEYTQFSNGTHNFSFDFRNNATFMAGPIRLIIAQRGDEIMWNDPNAKTGGGFMTKRYTFYEKNSWITIDQNFTNVGGSSITRNSTRGGAMSINDISTTEFFQPSFIAFWPTNVWGTNSNPGSWYGGSPGGMGFGIVNINYSGANYYAINDSDLSRIGINLETVDVPAGGSITETSAIHFNSSAYYEAMILNVRNELINPPAILQGNPQYIPASLTANKNYTLYNRNETVLIFGNITYDPYIIVSYVNATLDMGTAGTSDDVLVALYDDGGIDHGDAAASDGSYSNLFNLSEAGATGVWNITIKAYDIDGVLLNNNYTLFNVTNEYNVSVAILNPAGYVNRQVNATINVKNKRYDTYIAGAILNCSYGAGELTDIADYSNGTYFLNFTAPAVTGNYVLNCTASKYNNSGWDNQSFSTETSETILTLERAPENYTAPNISVSLGDSFNMSINVTDGGSANAQAVNISLSIPANLSANATFQQCGDISMGASCIKQFNISISNRTKPGNYTLNITVLWRNPNNSMNSTNSTLTAYVLSNPSVNVTPTNISGTVADGHNIRIGNFSVQSIGNDNITNTTYSVSGLPAFTITFIPPNISTLGSGLDQNVSINVSVPPDYAPGNYSGIINVSSENDEWKLIVLNITVPALTSVSLQKSPSSYASSIISFYSEDSFKLTITSNNTGIANAKNANITLFIPQNLSANSTTELCNNINVSTSCIRDFNISISNQTSPGNYTLNIITEWINPDLSPNSTTTNFTVGVLSNPLLNISDVQGMDTAQYDNTTITAGNFTVYSYGNDNLTNTTFNVSGLSNFTITFNPQNMSSLGINESQQIMVNVSVPFAYSPGNYSGTINVSAKNDGWKTFQINVSVYTRRNWSISPNHCDRAENPDVGTVCQVAIFNTGNTPLNFTISPNATNYTIANETNMTVQKNSAYYVKFTYNVTNITKEFYYSGYVINSTTPEASPEYQNFTISLVPYIAPIINASMSLTEAPQQKNILIYANVTDRSTTGINWTVLNITLPNGTTVLHNMSLLTINGTLSMWYFNYSGNMSGFAGDTGTTMQRGFYNFSIISQDNTGVPGEEIRNFTIYARLDVAFSTGETKYPQGSKWSVKYTAKDANGTGLEGANITIVLRNATGSLSYEPYFEKFTTQPNGQILPFPEFSLPDDAEPGIYNITANITYYDATANMTPSSINNASFTVQKGGGGGGGGLTADLRTTVVWYPDNIMRFQMFFSYGGNVTEPDNMTLQVFDPANNLYFSANTAEINETSPGRYQYKFAMPINTASGDYYAVLTAYKEGFMGYDINAFRVAKGGPYDVRLNIIPPLEVLIGDYVNFEISLENKGEVTQDAYVDYWVSYDGQTYYYNGEAVLTPVGVNTTIVRSAYIFNQPAGLTTLNVKVTYDSVQAPILLTGTFEVIDDSIDIPPPPPRPPGGEGGGGGGGGGGTTIIMPAEGTKTTSTISTYTGEKPQIEIESYNKDINIVKGWTSLESVKVKNNGKNPITNITLSITGIPSLWFNINPKEFSTLEPGASEVFLVEFKIPANVESGTYGLTFSASSKLSTDEKVGRLIIFTSIEELVNHELLDLRIELGKLAEDTDFAENIGKDVSKVREIIDQASTQIKSAENNIKNKLFDEALTDIQTASGLIKRGKRLLEAAGGEAVAAQKVESPWIFGLKALLIIILIASVALWSLRSKGKVNLAFLERYVKKKEKGSNEERKKELEEDKAKILRITRLLESELKEGVITQNAYSELKKRNDEKVARIDNELKNMK